MQGSLTGERCCTHRYTFRYDRDLKGRRKKYLNVLPSKQAVARRRAKLREMISSSQSHTPLPQLVERLNRSQEGWANYFRYGYPRGAWWEIDWYVRARLIRHLQGRSQRPYRPPRGVSWSEHLQRFGRTRLSQHTPQRWPAHA